MGSKAEKELYFIQILVLLFHFFRCLFHLLPGLFHNYYLDLKSVIDFEFALRFLAVDSFWPVFKVCQLWVVNWWNQLGQVMPNLIRLGLILWWAQLGQIDCVSLLHYLEKWLDRRSTIPPSDLPCLDSNSQFNLSLVWSHFIWLNSLLIWFRILHQHYN